MSIEVKVSIENGKSRIFLLDNEQSTLANLRSKIKEQKGEAVGSDFYFLRNGSEIDIEDEGEYRLSMFKKDDVIEVVISPQQSDDNKTTS
jgi:hypothetical protein